MYLPDLSPYRPVAEWPPLLSIGWLDRAHPYTTGSTPLAFQERLWLFCIHPFLFSMGIHECAFCTDSSLPRYTHPDGTFFHFGSVDIWVFGTQDQIYAAPGLIYHYVHDHQYCPPQEFIQAVLRCPLPTSRAYRQRRIHALGDEVREEQHTHSVVGSLRNWLQRRRRIRN